MGLALAQQRLTLSAAAQFVSQLDALHVCLLHRIAYEVAASVTISC